MASTILVMGSLNMDLITRTSNIPRAGETLTASSFSTGPGGKGANQAVACARASNSRSVEDRSTDRNKTCIEVHMIGGVGDDIYGERLVSELSSNGVNTENVKIVSDQASGVAVIIVEEKTGENRILVTPGANAFVDLRQLQILHDGSDNIQLIVLQLEIPLQTILAVIDYAKRHRIEVVLNPAPAVHIPQQSLNGLDHLIMNESEAQVLAGSSERCLG